MHSTQAGTFVCDVCVGRVCAVRHVPLVLQERDDQGGQYLLRPLQRMALSWLKNP